MIPSALEKILPLYLEKHLGVRPQLFAPSFIGGGSINQACRLRSSEGDFFVKWNNTKAYPGMFEKEAWGLQLLASSKAIRLPETIDNGEAGEFSFLLLEYIDSGKEIKDFWEDFAMRLALMHRSSAEQFGLDHNNYIGSLEQFNAFRPDWVTFFIEQRLEIQLKLALDKGKIEKTLLSKFEKLFKELPSIFPIEKPALIHGDLWSGNFMCAENGQVCIIDPAVYYGHREMDIAMSKLFGGFHFNFYAAYNRAWPLEAGWQGRVDICNLYPLMVHVNLFGASYLESVKRTLRAF